MSPMKLVYIAGPYRAKTPWLVSCNIAAARARAAEVVALGAFPVCPHTMTAHMDGLQTDEFWLLGTLALALRCDALLTFGAWRESAGAVGEVEHARANRIQVFHSRSDLAQWLGERRP